MGYQAISSTNGKIKQLLIAYNGKKESKAFVKNILRAFPADVKILVWTKDKEHVYEIKKAARKAGRKNFLILPQRPNNKNGVAKLKKRTPSKIETIWLRDAFWVCRKEGRWGIFASGFFSIPEELKESQLVDDHIFQDWLPKFGNVLFDRDHFFIGFEDLGAIKRISGKLAPEQYLLKALFPARQNLPMVVKLGYYQPVYANESISINITDHFGHTDLFLTSTGIDDSHGHPVVLLAQPESLDESLEEQVKLGKDLMELMGRQLKSAGVIVIRNPVPVLRPKPEKLWIGHFNNAIVEVTEESRKVWLPYFKFKNHNQSYLESIAARNRKIWEDLDFEVTFISGGMKKLSRGGNRAGALRCLTIDFR